MPEKPLKERESDFAADVLSFQGTYGPEMVNDFFLYWTEPNKSKTKMKFELQKTWDTARRLRTWERNNINWNRNGSAANRPNNGAPKPGTSTARVDALKDWGVK